MNHDAVKIEVRRVLLEIMQQMHPAYPVNGGAGFPHENNGGITKLPEDIDTKSDYLMNWVKTSSNQDLYSFPESEFKKGLEIEKSRNSEFNILDVAKLVIDKLKEDVNFYSNLGV